MKVTQIHNWNMKKLRRSSWPDGKYLDLGLVAIEKHEEISSEAINELFSAIDWEEYKDKESEFTIRNGVSLSPVMCNLIVTQYFKGYECVDIDLYLETRPIYTMKFQSILSLDEYITFTVDGSTVTKRSKS